MAKIIFSIAFLLLSATYIKAYDDIDLELENGIMGKILRAMVNQTKADTLNLPANSSSIRENITDTFSCDNRTYGYYADVDNDCQLFHVCLPTQAASGRSVTYKWSFICPNETVFNQEVLVCTRPLDAINCEDSPMYYDVNMEIGKETNDTKTEDKNVETIPMNQENILTNQENIPTNQDKIPTNQANIPTNQENIPTNQKNNKQRPQRRKPVKKQNLIIESLLKEVVRDKEESRSAMEIEPKIEDVNEGIPLTVDEEDFENSRLFGERSLKMRNEKSRGMFRFKADV